MPSSTSLLDADEGESEVPSPLVHAFAGIGLDEHHGTQSQSPEQVDDSLSFHHHQQQQQLPSVINFSLLGTVLDLKPLPVHQTHSGEEMKTAPENEKPGAAVDTSSVCTGSSLLAQAHHNKHLSSGLNGCVIPSRMEHVETVLLYNGRKQDDSAVGGGSALLSSSGMAMLPSGVFAEPGYETEPSLLTRRKSVNTTECVSVPSSEHVAEIVGRQGELLCV